MRNRIAGALALAGALAVAGGAHGSNAHGLIAFAGGSGRHVQIFTINPAGTGLRRLTTGLDHSEPSFSPDGTRIVYVAGGVRTPADVWTMNADGSDQRRLTFTPHIDEEDPSWSPDGRTIAFDTASGVWLMNSDGGDRRRLTWRVAGSTPSWSPDGSELVIGGKNGRLYVVPVSGGTPRRLPRGWTPAWSPDGQSIVFSRGSSLDLWLVSSDGSGLRPLTNTKLLFEFWPAWSSDGSQIVFSAQEGGCGAARLFVMNADGSDRRWLGVSGIAPSWQRRPATHHPRSCGFPF